MPKSRCPAPKQCVKGPRLHYHKRVNVRPEKYACEGFDYQTGRRRKYVRHAYTLTIDSDGNYRCCVRCRQVSLRLAAGERNRVR